MKLSRWFPYFVVLGPITGPLTRRLYEAIQERRPVLAAIYGFGVIAVLLALPLALIELLIWLQ